MVADALGLDAVRVLRTPIDQMGAAREQWNDGNNFLAVSPGVVMGYERNGRRPRQGAHVTYLDHCGSHVGHKESVRDSARVLGRMYANGLPS